MSLRAPVKGWRGALKSDQVVLAVMAVVVGIAVAYAAILFRLGIDLVQQFFLGVEGEHLITALAEQPWWRVLLAPAAGGLLVGLFLRFAMADGRAQSVAQVIEVMALRNGRMSLATGLKSAVVHVLSLGCGASTGREGPMVHLGATLAAWSAERLHLPPGLGRTILGCGVAAAVAASFNAPIAGVFFALEVIVGHYALAAFAPVVIASVSGTVVGRIHLGVEPAFVLPAYDVSHFLEFPAFALLGAVCALVALILMWSIMFAEDVVDSLPVPNWLKPAAGGLAVGAIAVNFPHVLGVGYEATDAALKGLLPLWLLIGLIMLKTAAVAISIGCRFGGGVFSPSLFLGAMTGGAFGLMAAWVFPELAASHGAYAIVGMTALAAAVLGAPISTILIVFELTGDYRMTIAAMIATSIASLIVQQTIGRSFFHWQLERRGLDLRGGRARHLLQSLLVRDMMSDDYTTIGANTSVGDLKHLLATQPYEAFVVVDNDNRLLGVISFADIKHVAFDDSLDDLINARDLVRKGGAVLELEETLEAAMADMDQSERDCLPVVVARDDRRVRGVVRRDDLLKAYNSALIEAQVEEHDDGSDWHTGNGHGGGGSGRR